MARPGLWAWPSPNSTGIFLHYPTQVTLPALPSFYFISNEAKLTSTPAFCSSRDARKAPLGPEAQLHNVLISCYTFSPMPEPAPCTLHGT